MKKYVVTEEFLKSYKDIVDYFASHKEDCSYQRAKSIASSPDSEFYQCDCGLKLSISKLKLLSLTILPVEEVK